MNHEEVERSKKYPLWVVQVKAGDSWMTLRVSVSESHTICILIALGEKWWMDKQLLMDVWLEAESTSRVRCVRCRRLKDGRIEVKED